MIATTISQGVQLSNEDSLLIVLGFAGLMVVVIVGLCELHERRLRKVH